MSVPQTRRGRRLWFLTVTLGLVLSFSLLLTSAEPWAPQKRTPTAQQVELARDAFRHARVSRSTGKPSDLVLTQAELDSISSMVSQGFAPSRLALTVHQGMLQVVVSRPLLNRWLNVRAKVSGESVGFPAVTAKVGLIHSPAWLTRIGLALGRRILILRGAQLPDLDSIVRSTRINRDQVHARLMFPPTGLIDEAVAEEALSLNDAVVSRIYCQLVTQQRKEPSSQFAQHMQRAISLADPTREGHGAALVALAMLVADPRAGELVGDTMTKARACLISPPLVTLQGRADLSKHWSLSAALTVSAGGRLALAMGEWKELSDSISTRAYLAKDDSSGFSLVDLAADRAGYFTARQLVDPASLLQARARATFGADEGILPVSLTRRVDRLSQAEFVRRYGTTDDPRFGRALESIDADLAKVGIN